MTNNRKHTRGRMTKVQKIVTYKRYGASPGSNTGGKLVPISTKYIQH